MLTRADAVVIRPGSFKDQRDRVVSSVRLIAKQCERRVLGDDEHIGAAVVVDVANRQPATQSEHLPGRTSLRGNIDEFALPLTEKELGTHGVWDRGAIVADMAVGLGQVEPAVVVGVESGQPKAEHQLCRRGQTRIDGPVAE